MPAGTAAQANADSAQRQIQIVVDNDQVFELDLEFSDQPATLTPLLFMKVCGLAKNNVVPCYSAFDDFGLAAAAGKTQAVFVAKWSTHINPMLWRLPAYFVPGFPSPAINLTSVFLSQNGK
jgi:hypothetical protein